MSDWRHFIEPDNDCYFELLVGPYERWIQQVPRGTTQLDRAMIHTPMMDSAHERRLMVTQDGLDMSRYEATHCGRLQGALDMLDERIRVYGQRSETLDLLDLDTNCAGGQFAELESTWPQKVVLSGKEKPRSTIPVTSLIHTNDEALIAGDSDESDNSMLADLLTSLKKPRSDIAVEVRNVKRQRVRKDSGVRSAQTKEARKDG